MIYDRHQNQQNKRNKAFWARGYYVATIGNATEEAIKKYISEQSEESKKEATKAPWEARANHHLKWWLMTFSTKGRAVQVESPSGGDFYGSDERTAVKT